MESTRPNKKNISFDELVKVIEGHSHYLSHHASYIKKIEAGLVSEEDIQCYLEDVFQIKKITKDEFVKAILPTLKDTIKIRISDNNELLQSTKMEDKDQALCYCHFILNFQLTFITVQKNIARSKEVHYLDKIQSAFNSYDDLKFLQKSLENKLPSYISDFNTVFIIKEKFETKYSRKNIMEKDYSAVRNIHWEAFGRNLKLELGKTLSFFQGVGNNAKVPAEFLTLLQYIKDIGVQDKKNRADFKKDLTEEQEASIFKENIELFFRVNPLFQKLQDWIKNEKQAATDRKILIEFYKEITAKTKSELTILKKQYQVCINLLNQDKRNSELEKELEKNLKSLQKTINKLSQQLPEECPLELKTKDEIEEKLNNFYETQHQVVKKLDEIHQKLIEYHQEMKTLAAAKKAESERVEQEKIALLQKQCEELAEKKAGYQKFKDDQLKKKEERKQSRERLAESTTAMNDVSQNVTLFKNVVMEDLLNKLSSNHLILLKSILMLEIGATYDDVYYLITNHLGGKISEIGNGSSHKRIQLEKFYVEMITSGVEVEIENSKLAVGGFFKPHGKAHNSGLLSRFNLELVQQTFLKAGITLELIEKLELNKQSSKEENSLSMSSSFLSISPSSPNGERR